jgi:hypothetical protein
MSCAGSLCPEFFFFVKVRFVAVVMEPGQPAPDAKDIQDKIQELKEQKEKEWPRFVRQKCPGDCFCHPLMTMSKIVDAGQVIRTITNGEYPLVLEYEVEGVFTAGICREEPPKFGSAQVG